MICVLFIILHLFSSDFELLSSYTVLLKVIAVICLPSKKSTDAIFVKTL